MNDLGFIFFLAPANNSWPMKSYKITTHYRNTCTVRMSDASTVCQRV